MNLRSLVKTVVRPLVGDLPDQIRQRQRVRALEASRVAVSKERLVLDLGRLPIRSGAPLLVHSSLKALGFVEGGAATVVDSLITAIVERNGSTVISPTFSIDGSMHRTLLSGRSFDQRATPSNLGAIPEVFRKHPRAKRSLHPTHSLAAIGPEAGALVEGHHLAGSSFGESTPMAKLLAAGGYLLGLGTDLGRVTFYHCLEEIEDAFPLDVFTPDSPLNATCRDEDGAVHNLSVRAHDPARTRGRIDHPESTALRAFFRERLEKHAGLSWHRVGETDAWLVEAERLYAEIKRLMQAGITIYSSPTDIEDFRSSAWDESGSGP